MGRAIAYLCLLCLGLPAVADAKRARAVKLTGSGHVPAKVFERGSKRLTGTLTVRTPAPAPRPGAPQPEPPSPVLETVTEVLSSALGVTAREFSLLLSRERVATGSVTLSYANRGEDPHDLVLRPLDGQGGGGGFPEVASLGTATKKVTLAAGRYELLCTLPGHAAAGMRATLRAG